MTNARSGVDIQTAGSVINSGRRIAIDRTGRRL